MDEIKLHKSGKTSDLTHVLLSDYPEDGYLGYVKRIYASNSSPRGGAYRWEYQAKGPSGKWLGQYPTRKEAIEQVVRQPRVHKCGVEPPECSRRMSGES